VGFNPKTIPKSGPIFKDEKEEKFTKPSKAESKRLKYKIQ
jgi:hypothetical protein